MVHSLNTRISAAALPLMALSLTAAAPPQGPELSVGLGAGTYMARELVLFGSDPGPERGTAGIADLRFSYRADRWSLHIQQTTAPAHLYRPPDRRFFLTSTTVVRGGWHHDRFGIEAGVAAGHHAGGFSDEFLLLPSLRVWAGEPRLVYGYAGIASDLMSGGALGLWELGLGHAGEGFRAELGTMGPWSFSARMELPVGGDVWLGLEGGLLTGPILQDDDLDARALLRMTFGPGVFRGGASD